MFNMSAVGALREKYSGLFLPAGGGNATDSKGSKGRREKDDDIASVLRYCWNHHRIYSDWHQYTSPSRIPSLNSLELWKRTAHAKEKLVKEVIPSTYHC